VISESWEYESSMNWPLISASLVNNNKVTTIADGTAYRSFPDYTYKLSKITACYNSGSPITKITFESTNAMTYVDRYVVAKNTCDGYSRFIYQSDPCFSDYCEKYILIAEGQTCEENSSLMT
jgi:hypothetical protein